MGLYMNPPTQERYNWAQEHLEHTNVLPQQFDQVPADKVLVVCIGVPFEALWIVDTCAEFKRMWANMKNPAFERVTDWFYATPAQIAEHT